MLLHLLTAESGRFQHAAAQCRFGREQGEADMEMVDQGDYHDALDPSPTFGFRISRSANGHCLPFRTARISDLMA
jgi:hypothetical protein